MTARIIFAGAGAAGLLLGSLVAATTPVSFKPAKDPEWRVRAMALREETAQTYAYSMPEELSPRIGFGNPAVHDRYARMTAEVAWIEPAPPPMPDITETGEVSANVPAEPAPLVRMHTGNETTIAQLKLTSAAFDPESQGSDGEAASGETPATITTDRADALLR